MEQDYFAWLCEIVDDKSPIYTYDMLLLDLARTNFEIMIPNDINRCMDGVNLRYEYASENPIFFEKDLTKEPCTVLEMLVSLARRVNYELSDNDPIEHDHTPRYFWEMIANLGLDNFDDAHYSSSDVRDILKRFLYRDYTYSGEGGLFPLRYPVRDQRDVEIWYQMNAYLQENYPC